MDFKDYVVYQKYLNEESHIYEMANIDPRTHKFGIDVKIHILQPGKRKLSHGPRLKIFKKKNQSFIITLPKDIVNIDIQGDTSFLKQKEVNSLVQIAKHYKEAFVAFWCNDDMSSDELMDYIESINKNEQIEKFRNEFPIDCY